jgi:hypothetical protein
MRNLGAVGATDSCINTEIYKSNNTLIKSYNGCLFFLHNETLTKCTLPFALTARLEGALCRRLNPEKEISMGVSRQKKVTTDAVIPYYQ